MEQFDIKKYLTESGKTLVEKTIDDYDVNGPPPPSFFDMVSKSRMGTFGIAGPAKKYSKWAQHVKAKWEKDLKDPSVRDSLKKRRRFDLTHLVKVIG